MNIAEKIENISDTFDRKIAQAELKLFKSIRQDILTNPELFADTTKRGKSQRMKIIANILNKTLDYLKQSGYYEVVNYFIKEFDNIEQLQVKETKKEWNRNKDIIDLDSVDISQLKQIKNSQLSYLNDLGIPIQKILEDYLIRSVYEVNDISSLIDNIETFITGNESKGIISKAISAGNNGRYAKTYARDSLSVYQRTILNTQTNKIKNAGLEFVYAWTGGLVEDSRPICIACNGNYYDEDAIEYFTELNYGKGWKGHNRLANFKYVVGGYNCLHTLFPVSPENREINIPNQFLPFKFNKQESK